MKMKLVDARTDGRTGRKIVMLLVNLTMISEHIGYVSYLGMIVSDPSYCEELWLL